MIFDVTTAANEKMIQHKTYSIDKQLLSDLRLLTRKRSNLLELGNRTAYVAVGSSRGAYGFNPMFAPYSCNLCSISQDLTHSFLLYEYANKHCQSIKGVVVFYSSFSNGFKLAKTNEKWRCAALKEVFSLDAPYHDNEIERSIESCSGISYGVHAPGNAHGFVHNDPLFFFPNSYGADRRAADHMKGNQRGGQNIHLFRIVIEAQTRRQKVIVVIPPARSDYRAHLPSTEVLFKDLFASREECESICDFTILNLYDDSEFIDNHFGDFDHLHPYEAGTELLTRKVAKHLSGH